MSKNENEQGPCRKPPEKPYKKHRLGAISQTPGRHPGRRGLMGQQRKSMGYVQNGKHKQSPSGTRG